MKKNEYSVPKPENFDNTRAKNTRRLILKIIVGVIFIAALFFIAINISKHKLAQLSETVSAIIEPNIKLIKLKEISECLYNAEANVKAYTIGKDSTYLIKYENYISDLNTHLDTLLWLSDKRKITDTLQAKANQIFIVQIDSLRELIIIRLDLFYAYIALKTDGDNKDVLLNILKEIKIKGKSTDTNQNAHIKKKSFINQLFASKKQDKVTSDSLQDNIVIKIITQSQKEEQVKEISQLSKEFDITQQGYLIMNHIFSLLNSMEENELAESIKRVRNATNETNAQIKFVSLWFTTFGFILILVFLYFIYHDIMKSKRFKEKLHQTKRNAEKLASQYSLSLIEASLDPLVTINSDGKITDMNEATVSITGISREALSGSDFFIYFTELEKAREVYKEVFEKGSVADYPLTLRHKSGKLTNVLFNGSVYRDEKRNVIGVVVVARDITEQKRFENELIEAKSNAECATQKAEESNKLKEAFLSNMSHEIRTPMNAIMGFSDILFRRNLDEQEKEYVTIIKTAGENLLTIINDILDISKIEAGMMSFEEKNFSVKEIFKSLHEMLNVKATEKKLNLMFVCDTDVPESLLGDPTRLMQILINLVGNAIKFTDKGEIKVQARFLKKKNEKICVTFSVEDTGIGIQNEKLNGIFERFSQAASNTSRKYGGTGLGLSIAKQLVELQGGALSVKSEPKRGSVFSFIIPYKKSTDAHLVKEKIEKTFDISKLNRLNILLVEDNILNVLLVKSLFSELNLSLQVAENGSIGIEKIKETKFDIVLMDMEMPIMNGYEATYLIRNELNNNIPIIAMTAHAMQGEKEKCLSFGMNDYISKPINANLLFDKIYNLTINSKYDEQ